MVKFFLMMFLLCHATLTLQVIFLLATVNLFWDPPFPRVLSFSFWRPDFGPCATSLLLQKISLRPLP
jgi:hypothetical protein